ncbi:MAG: ComEC/Rec2 family competence protein, partial [Vicinamibacterales bacterium]
MHAPACLVAVPLLAGAATSILFVDAVGDRFALTCAGAAALVLIAAIGAVLQDDRAEAVVSILIGFLLIGLSLGATAARGAYDPPLLRWFESAAPSEPVILEGLLRDDASPTAFGVSLTIDVTSVDGFSRADGFIGGARVSVGGSLVGPHVEQWRAGRAIRAPAFLRRPSTYLNPGTPDERPPLARRGIVLVGSIKSAALVEVVRRGTVLSEAAAAIRAWTRQRVAARMTPLDPKSAGVTTAVLIGDRSGLSSDDERRLQEAGTYHVIAISGGNIAVLAVLILFAARLLILPPRPAAILTAALLLFYGMIAAGAASVSRAVTVAVILLSARAVDHRGSALNALATAAALAVAHRPVLILDAGFILSFGATLGILIGVPRIVTIRAREGGPRPPGVLRRLVLAPVAALCAATLCAEAALAPVGATFFGRVSFAGLILNFVAIPLMTVVQVGGLLLALTASWWDRAAAYAATVAHLAAAGLLQSARLVDVAPWLALDVRPPAAWLTAIYYASALSLLSPRIRRSAGVVWLITGAVMLAGPRAAARDAVPASRMPLRVVVLDVGQGDASVVLLPDGRALLVDAGGMAAFSSPEQVEVPTAFDVGERIVARALRSLAVSRVHGLVLTHGDPDHIMGVPGLLRRIPAGSVWEGVPVPPHQPMKRIAALAREQSMTWRTVQAGDEERFREGAV